MEDLVRVKFDLWSSLLAFGVFQGLLLALVLLSFKRSISVYFLVGMVLILVLNLFNYLLLSTNLFLEIPHLVYIFTPLMYLIGPIYYWYIKSILVSEYQLTIKSLVHLLPFVVGILFLLPFFILDGNEKTQLLESYYQSRRIPLSLATFSFISVQILQSFLYIFWSNKYLRTFAEKGKSRQVKTKVIWLQRFSLSFLIYWLIDLIALSWYSFQGSIHQEVFYVTTLCNTVFINVLVFFAIRNNKAFNQVLLNASFDTYRNSTLSKSDANRILGNIIEFMEKEKPYLDPELSLTKLSTSLDLSQNQVSQVLNSELKKSFYEFINEYRFSEVKSRLGSSQYKHLTILAIALDSGFNNKNTFNKVFKKHAGQTPSEFLKNLVID